MRLYFLSLCFLLLGLSSCSYKKLEFEKASGKVNKVEKGDRFSISLPEDHKTPFYWTISHDYDRKVLSYIRSSFHGTTVEFSFDAIRKGKTEITLALSGYQETKDTKTFVIEVE